MHKYIVTAAAGLTVPHGTLLKLTPPQLAGRRDMVREVAGGHFVEQPLQFKRGETVVLRGELPKVLAALVEDPVKAKAEADAKAKAAAEAQSKANAEAEAKAKADAEAEAKAKAEADKNGKLAV